MPAITTSTGALGSFFEAKVATGFVAFLQNYQPEHDDLWTVIDNGQIIGSIALDRQHDLHTAPLRWFILDPAVQGKGLGKQRVERTLPWISTEAQVTALKGRMAMLELNIQDQQLDERLSQLERAPPFDGTRFCGSAVPRFCPNPTSSSAPQPVQ